MTSLHINLHTKAKFAIVVVFTMVAAISWAQKTSSTSDAGSSAVKQVVANFSDSFNHHDAHDTAELFAEEADFTNMRGVSHHGRKEIEQNFMTLYAGPLKDAHRMDSVKNVRFLSPSVAEMDASWEMSGTKAADGSANPARKGFFDWVLEKVNGKWMIMVFHESELPS